MTSTFTPAGKRSIRRRLVVPLWFRGVIGRHVGRAHEATLRHLLPQWCGLRRRAFDLMRAMKLR